MSLKFSCFVTGTDTDVGKTLIAASLLRLCVEQGWRSVGMKPVAAGCVQDASGQWRNTDVEALAAAGSDDLDELGISAVDCNPYLFHDAIAPHVAAARLGQQIELEHLCAAYQRLSAVCEAVIVEGAGGWLVPLNEQHSLADLAVRLQLPVVLVVGMRLGCINHALLTQEAVHARGLQLAGWVANTCVSRMNGFDENLLTLQSCLQAPLLGVVPFIPHPCRDFAARHLRLPGMAIQDGHE